MKKIISLTLVMAMLLFVLTGCVKIDYEVKVNKNGSADLSFVYALEKETIEQMGGSTESPTKEMEEQSQESGYKIESYSDDKYVGFKASKHLDKATETSLQEVFGEEYVKDSDDNKIKVEKKDGKTVYSQNAEIDLSGLKEMASSIKGFEMKYTVKLPAKASSSNADEVSKDGKTLTWNLKIGEINKIEFSATQSGTSPIIIVAAVVVALVVIGVVFVAVKGSKKGEKASVSEEKTEEPVVEEPVAEEPIVEEPSDDEQEAKEDKKEE